MGIFSRKSKNQTENATGLSPSPTKRGFRWRTSKAEQGYEWDTEIPQQAPIVVRSMTIEQPVVMPPTATADVVLAGFDIKDDIMAQDLHNGDSMKNSSSVSDGPKPWPMWTHQPKLFNLVVSAGTAPEVELPSYEVQQLNSALECLKVTGNGLTSAAKIDSDVNDQLVLIATEVGLLKDAFAKAFGHRQNVEVFTNFVTSVIQTLDARAKHGGINNSKALSQIYDCISEGCALVQSCSKPGWFNRMCRCDAPINAKFAKIHQDTLEILSKEGWDEAQELASLTIRLDTGDYDDVAYNTKHILREVGNGLSMDAGLRRIKTDVTARMTVAESIGVPPESLIMEIIFTLDSASVMALPDGPLRDVECRRVFQPYATPEEDTIPFDGFYSLMEDLCMLESLPPEEKAPAVRSAFVTADSNYDGFIDIDEFRTFYTSQYMSLGQVELRLQTTLKVERRLRQTFSQFATFGVHRIAGEASAVAMDSTQFVKLCKDSGLLNSHFTRDHVQLIFNVVKPKESRKINFPEFVGALSHLAAAKGKPLGDIVHRMLGIEPNVKKATHYVRLHDDKSTYTGIYARGGPDCGRPVKILLENVVARPSGGMVTPRSPAPRMPSSTRLEITRPSSPRLQTAARARPSNTMPTTPGRGAEIIEGKKQEAKPTTPMYKSPAGPPRLATAARAEARSSAATTASTFQASSNTKKSAKKTPAMAFGRRSAPTVQLKSPSLKSSATKQKKAAPPSPSPAKASKRSLNEELNMTVIEAPMEEVTRVEMPEPVEDVQEAESFDWTKLLEEEKSVSVEEEEIVEPEAPKIWTEDEIEEVVHNVFNSYATTDVYDEDEPVLDEDGFRTMLCEADVTSAGVGLPASSMISIFDISANAVSNLMTYRNFGRALQLIAARTALPLADLKKHIATSPPAAKGQSASKVPSVAAIEEPVSSPTKSVTFVESLVEYKEMTIDEISTDGLVDDDELLKKPVELQMTTQPSVEPVETPDNQSIVDVDDLGLEVESIDTVSSDGDVEREEEEKEAELIAQQGSRMVAEPAAIPQLA